MPIPLKGFLFSLLLLSNIALAQKLTIIPEPVSVKQPKIAANFTISPATEMVMEGSNMDNIVIFFNDYLQKFYGFKLKVGKTSPNKNAIRLNFERMDEANAGAYVMTVDKNGVYIAGDNEAGIFYGMQTLIQLLPVPNQSTNQPINKSTNQPTTKLLIPYVSIEDAPRFAYRGMHLDVSRHFFPVNYIKQYIDYIALHKMNYFHWHLTDDQGWRIDIFKYPLLTQVGAWRKGTIIGRYPGTGNDNVRHGGYYTNDQVKDIVDYAAKRYITVIPEIEIPGHSMAALAGYPQLGTTPDSGYAVAQTWGINDRYNNVLSPTEYTFNFYEHVLDEVIKLFPSLYIHIGGDEVSKRWWHESAFCQQLMKEKGLKDEHALQSYFIQRIEKYVNSKGRKIIGWDEILEGGLAPNATVMSWRGEQGGIDAAKQDHDVIMTPGNPVYFDHSQTQNEDSVTIGGYNPIEKVYAYEPIPKELNEEQAKHVLGAQANVWTEYMAYPSKIEYMIFPRMSALSEVLWSPKEKRNWDDFQKRLMIQFKRYDLWKVNYSKAYFDLKATVVPASDNKGVIWRLSKKSSEGSIRIGDGTGSMTYDMNSYDYKVTDSSKYGSYQAAWVKIISRTPNASRTRSSIKLEYLSNPIYQQFHFNKATGKKITLVTPPSQNYPGDGAFTLVNGIINEKGFARSSEFIAFNGTNGGTNCEAIIDLGSSQSISSVVVNILRRESSWIWRPQTAEAFGSNDGTTWNSLKLTDDLEPAGGVEKGKMIMSFNATNVRYVKVVVTNWGIIPDGNPGAGKTSWLFVDEIEVW